MSYIPRYAFVALAITLIGTGSREACADNASVQAIFDHMVLLKPLIGQWKADVDFHDRDGSVVNESAEYAVQPVLDGTYLKWDVTVHRNDSSGSSHSFMIMTTYNPETKKYDQTYFYSRWAMRVTETGEYDASAREYRTTAFVPREDGVHDESVRTVTKFEDGGVVEHWHYSRYDNEKAELMNFHARLVPQK